MFQINGNLDICIWYHFVCHRYTKYLVFRTFFITLWSLWNFEVFDRELTPLAETLSYELFLLNDENRTSYFTNQGRTSRLQMYTWLVQKENIAKGTTDPRVEFCLPKKQVIIQILIKFQNSNSSQVKSHRTELEQQILTWLHLFHVWVLFPAWQFSTGIEKSSFFVVPEQASCARQEIDLPLIVLKGRLCCG